jgi:hypothetical protein
MENEAEKTAVKRALLPVFLQFGRGFFPLRKGRGGTARRPGSYHYLPAS